MKDNQKRHTSLSMEEALEIVKDFAHTSEGRLPVLRAICLLLVGHKDEKASRGYVSLSEEFLRDLWATLPSEYQIKSKTLPGKDEFLKTLKDLVYDYRDSADEAKILRSLNETKDLKIRELETKVASLDFDLELERQKLPSQIKSKKKPVAKKAGGKKK